MIKLGDVYTKGILRGEVISIEEGIVFDNMGSGDSEWRKIK